MCCENSLAGGETVTYIIGGQPLRSLEIVKAIEKFRGRSTGTLGHSRSIGFLHGLQPLVRPSHAVGFAVTASLTPFDAAAAHYAVSLLTPGDVLVVGTGGEEKRGCWGGGTAYAAYHASAAGVVIDGPVTDWDEITHIGVPTWCRGTTSLTYRRAEQLNPEGGVNVPVAVSGTIVNPGDLVFADSDGVFCIPAAEVIEAAEVLTSATEREPKTWRALAQGARMFDVGDSRAQFEAKSRSETSEGGEVNQCP
jgi:4-hydroxy-4-methyl-2-oxoglutarate aldolase